MQLPFTRKEPSKAEPADVEQRATALAAEEAAWQADNAELADIDSRQNAANAELSAAEAEVRRIDDPIVAVDTSDKARAAAIQRLRDARTALAKARADRVALPHSRASLDRRAQELRVKQKKARLAQLNTDHKADVAAMVRLFEEGIAVHARIIARLNMAAHGEFSEAEIAPDGTHFPKRAGLPDVTFPPGVFDVFNYAAHTGEALPTRTIWRDHVLRSVAEAYPDLLPAEHAEAILKRLASDKELGNPRWFAAPAHGWDIHRPRRFQF